MRRNVLSSKYCILGSRFHIWIRLFFFTVYVRLADRTYKTIFALNRMVLKVTQSIVFMFAVSRF